MLIAMVLLAGQVAATTVPLDAPPFAGQAGVKRFNLGRLNGIPIQLAIPPPAADGFMTVLDFDAGEMRMYFLLDVPKDLLLDARFFSQPDASGRRPGGVTTWTFRNGRAACATFLLDVTWRHEGDGLGNALRDKVVYLRVRSGPRLKADACRR